MCDSAKNFYADSNGKCCPLGTYEDSGVCKPIEVDNCDESPNVNSCGTCNASFPKIATNRCSDIPHPICKTFVGLYNNSLCTTCQDESNYYISDGNCCRHSEYYSTSQTKCLSIYERNSPRCKKFSEGKCIECVDSTKYPSNGHCCPHNNYFKNDTCVPVVDILLSNCKLVDDNLAADTNDTAYFCKECDAGHYIHLDKCCAFNHKYQATSSTCVEVTADNCKEYKD